MINIFIKNVENLKIPHNANLNDAGYDVIATSNPKIIYGGEKDMDIRYIEYETNIFIAPQPDEYQQSFHTLLFPRSSISNKNLVLANSIGLIDNGYRAMIKCRFKYIITASDIKNSLCIRYGDYVNGADTGVEAVYFERIQPCPDSLYSKGDKIAQLVASPTYNINFITRDDLDDTQRGMGGFGSTGI